MATLDAYLKGVAAAVSLTFALAVWWGGRERRETRLLALFLALIGANQAFETLRALDPGGAAGWLRAATVAAALDPLALVAYARGRLGERFVPRRLVLAAGAASVALALAAPWVVPREQRVPASHAVETALVAYTAAAYSLVLVAYARALRDDAARPAEAPLYVGVSLVAMPLWSRAAGDVVALASTWPRLAPLAPAKVLVGLAVAGALSAAWLAWLRGARRPALRGGAWAGLALTVLLDVPGLATAAADLGLLPDSVGGLGSVGRAAAALRWLLFGAAASMAVFRDDLLGMSLAARRRAARATLGLAFVLAAAVGLLALDAAWGGGGSVGLPHLVALAGAALVSQGFRRLVDRAAARVYGVPLPGDALAAREAYRRAAALAASRGRVPENDPALARLRDELGLDEPTARLLARLADEDLGPLAAGQAVAGRYQVERFLGRGAAGRAFVATDLVLGRRVVLKEVLTDGAHDASIQEARLAGALQHPAVVTVHDVLQRPGRAIIVQEHVPGGTLADRLAARGPYGLAAGAEVLRALVGGVAAVHDRGILHLDIKPENVLLVDDCTPKLGDFGVARLRGATLGAAGPVGTPGYAAPELLRGEPPTPACDVHALGRLALRCLGAPLPPAVEAVLARAVDADPARRPATAGALLADLERAFAS